VAEDYEAYINAEFVDMVTNESWSFPTPYWEVDESEEFYPNIIQSNFFIVLPTVIEAIDEFIEQLKRNGDNGNEFKEY